MLYSPSKVQFFNRNIHKNIPSDVVEISFERYQQIQNETGVLVNDKNNMPIKVPQTYEKNQAGDWVENVVAKVNDSKKTLALKISIFADFLRTENTKNMAHPLLDTPSVGQKEFFIDQRRFGVIVYDVMSTMSGFIALGEDMTRFGFRYLSSAANDVVKQNALISFIESKRTGHFEAAIRSAETYLLNKLGSPGIGFIFYSNVIKYYAQVLINSERITTVYSAVGGKEISLLSRLNEASTETAVETIKSTYEQELVGCIPSASGPRR
jgi:hypothetical protein